MEGYSAVVSSYDACWLCHILAASKEEIRATPLRFILGKGYTEVAGAIEAEKCQMTKKHFRH